MNQTSLVNELNGKSSNKAFIKDFETNQKLTNEQYAIKSLRHGITANGKSYIDLVLTDKSGEVAGKIWENNIDNCQKTEIGKVVEISGSVDEFRDKHQVNISFLQNCEKFDLSNFLPTSTKDLDLLWKTILANIKMVKDKNLKKLLQNFFDDSEFTEQFRKAPGAEFIHHAYIGGLMEHVVEMLNLANTILIDNEDLDKDLLITGVLLHDIGKMQELAVEHTIYRTIEGTLAGHISLGTIEIDKQIATIKNFPRELRAKILNIILSHHERLEFGSPVRPMTPEAFALCYIDNLSAKVNTARKVVNDNQNSDAEYSDKNFALDTKLFLK